MDQKCIFLNDFVQNVTRVGRMSFIEMGSSFRFFNAIICMQLHAQTIKLFKSWDLNKFRKCLVLTKYIFFLTNYGYNCLTV